MIFLGGNLYDGYDPRFAYQVGPQRSYTDSVTRSLKYERDLRVIEGSWRQSPFSTGGPSGGVLISESHPHSVGAGEIEWTQTFAFVPATRTVPETITYPLQVVTGGEIGELPLTVVAQVTYEYFYDPSGTAVTPYRTYRIVKVGSTIFYVGTPPGFGLFVAQDSKIRPWAGFIVERATPRISRQTLTAVP